MYFLSFTEVTPPLLTRTEKHLNKQLQVFYFSLKTLRKLITFPKGINRNIIKVNQRRLGFQKVRIGQPPVYRAPAAHRAPWWIRKERAPTCQELPPQELPLRTAALEKESFIKKSLYPLQDPPMENPLQDWLISGPKGELPLGKGMFLDYRRTEMIYKVVKGGKGE